MWCFFFLLVPNKLTSWKRIHDCFSCFSIFRSLKNAIENEYALEDGKPFGAQTWKGFRFAAWDFNSIWKTCWNRSGEPHHDLSIPKKTLKLACFAIVWLATSENAASWTKENSPSQKGIDMSTSKNHWN